MAIIACKECTGKVSTDAEACPHCGAKVPPVKGKPVNAGVAAAIFAGLFVIIWYVARDVPATPPQPSTAPVENVAHVSLEFSRTNLRLTNIDTLNWREATIYVNGMPPGSYKHVVNAPAPGGSVTIDLNDFVNANNDRFDPYAKQVGEVWVGGGGFDFKCYRVGR